METGDGISLNKRGSGVRRLVLVSFFRAEAERQIASGERRGIIYAIEEPETAQHPSNQRILLQSIKAISENDGCQVILTTHSPGFASELPVDSIRFITRDSENVPLISSHADIFGEVAEALGVTPDSRVRVLFCVEGPTDVMAFKALSRALYEDDPTFLDLNTDERVAFVVLGGGTLKHWVANNYLKGLGKPEVHIYDNDVASYGDAIDEVNRRTDGSWGCLRKV